MGEQKVTYQLIFAILSIFISLLIEFDSFKPFRESERFRLLCLGLLEVGYLFYMTRKKLRSLAGLRPVREVTARVGFILFFGLFSSWFDFLPVLGST